MRTARRSTKATELATRRRPAPSARARRHAFRRPGEPATAAAARAASLLRTLRAKGGLLVPALGGIPVAVCEQNPEAVHRAAAARRGGLLEPALGGIPVAVFEQHPEVEHRAALAGCGKRLERLLTDLVLVGVVGGCR